jgi:hypothetical protein
VGNCPTRLCNQDKQKPSFKSLLPNPTFNFEQQNLHLRLILTVHLFIFPHPNPYLIRKIFQFAITKGFKMNSSSFTQMLKIIIVTIFMLSITLSFAQAASPKEIDLAKNWRFSPDEENVGKSQEWFSPNYDDSKWATINAGTRWEELGYKELDGFGWYRKTVKVPADWKGQDIWLKIEAVNDAYELFINGESVSYFGEANITVASTPTFTEISKNLKYGAENLITIQVNDWGNSGGLWRLPVILTTDRKKIDSIFKPLSDTRFTAESLGYELVWQDEFEGDTLDSTKWAVRGVGPRATGFVSPDAVRLYDGFLELSTFVENDSIKTGAVGTAGRYMPKYGYYECRAQLQKSAGNWAAFWIQSPGIAKGEDPGKFGTEIDIFEYFKGHGENFVSHNLHWAYGPNQKTSGAMLSRVEGVDEGFHTFSLEWTPEKYAFFVDGLKYYEVTEAISHIEQYIILSMELPSTEEGLKDALFPDAFIIDYVRVYQKK